MGRQGAEVMMYSYHAAAGRSVGVEPLLCKKMGESAWWEESGGGVDGVGVVGTCEDMDPGRDRDSRHPDPFGWE